jgi:hypothetical protein
MGKSKIGRNTPEHDDDQIKEKRWEFFSLDKRHDSTESKKNDEFNNNP